MVGAPDDAHRSPPLHVKKHADKIAHEDLILLNVVDDVHLVEYDAGIEDIERGVVNGAGKNNILQELQPVRLMDLALNSLVAKLDDIAELGVLTEKFTISCLVLGKFWVVYKW